MQECLVEEEEKERRLVASALSASHYPPVPEPTEPTPPDLPSDDVDDKRPLTPPTDAVEQTVREETQSAPSDPNDQIELIDTLTCQEPTEAADASAALERNSDSSQSNIMAVDEAAQSAVTAVPQAFVEKRNRPVEKIQIEQSSSVAPEEAVDEEATAGRGKRSRNRICTQIPSPFGIVEEPIEIDPASAFKRKGSHVEITDVTDLLPDEPLAAAADQGRCTSVQSDDDELSEEAIQVPIVVTPPDKSDDVLDGSPRSAAESCHFTQVVEIADDEPIVGRASLKVCGPIFETLHEEMEEVTELSADDVYDQADDVTLTVPPPTHETEPDDETTTTRTTSEASEHSDATECELHVDWEILPEVDRHFDEFFPSDEDVETDEQIRTAPDCQPRQEEAPVASKLVPSTDLDEISIKQSDSHVTLPSAATTFEPEEPTQLPRIVGSDQSSDQVCDDEADHDASDSGVMTETMRQLSEAELPTEITESEGFDSVSVATEISETFDETTDVPSVPPSLTDATRNFVDYLVSQVFKPAHSAPERSLDQVTEEKVASTDKEPASETNVDEPIADAKGSDQIAEQFVPGEEEMKPTGTSVADQIIETGQAIVEQPSQVQVVAETASETKKETATVESAGREPVTQQPIFEETVTEEFAGEIICEESTVEPNEQQTPVEHDPPTEVESNVEQQPIFEEMEAKTKELTGERICEEPVEQVEQPPVELDTSTEDTNVDVLRDDEERSSGQEAEQEPIAAVVAEDEQILTGTTAESMENQNVQFENAADQEEPSEDVKEPTNVAHVEQLEITETVATNESGDHETVELVPAIVSAAEKQPKAQVVQEGADEDVSSGGIVEESVPGEPASGETTVVEAVSTEETTSSVDSVAEIDERPATDHEQDTGTEEAITEVSAVKEMEGASVIEEICQYPVDNVISEEPIIGDGGDEPVSLATDEPATDPVVETVKIQEGEDSEDKEPEAGTQVIEKPSAQSEETTTEQLRSEEQPVTEASARLASIVELGQHVLDTLPDLVGKLVSMEAHLPVKEQVCPTQEAAHAAVTLVDEIDQGQGDESGGQDVAVAQHMEHRECASPTLGENTPGPPVESEAAPERLAITATYSRTSERTGEELELETQWHQVQNLLASRLDQLESARSSTQTSSVRYLATVTQVTVAESVEERIVKLQDDFSTLKTAIMRKEVVVIQRVIITIVRTVTEWLETIEYRVYTIKQTNSIDRKIEECKSLQEEVRVVEESLQTLEEVTELAVEVINEETKVMLHKCVRSLQHQVQVIGQVTKRSEEEIQQIKRKWDDYLNRISQEEDKIKQLVAQMDSLLNSDQEHAEHKLIWLEDIETCTQERLAAMSELMAVGSDLIKEIPFYDIPGHIYDLYDTIKGLEGSLQDERDKLLHRAALTAEYRQTLEEFADIVQLSHVLTESKMTGRNAQEAVQEMEKRQRFLFCLSHLLHVLETLEGNLDPFTRSQCQQLHTRLVAEASAILETAQQKQQHMDLALQLVCQLEEEWNVEEDFYEQLLEQIPDLSSISADHFDPLTQSLQVSHWRFYYHSFIYITRNNQTGCH